MIKAIIIDDEPLARNLVKEYLQRYTDVQVVEECKDGFEGAKAILAHDPDLVFLDIQMPKISGFEMLELLEQVPPVIFTTAFDEYAIRAFEAHAVDYLLKPFSEERFSKAMQQWKERFNNGKGQPETKALLIETAVLQTGHQRIVVRNGSHIRIIPSQEIYYLEAYDDYVKIHTLDDCFLKKQTLAYYETNLPQADFLRTHRSFLVRLSAIDKIEPFEKGKYLALIKNGKKIPLSRAGYIRIKEVLGI